MYEIMQKITASNFGNAVYMHVSDMTITRKLRAELSDTDKAAIIAHIDAIAADRAKEKAATA